MKSLSYIAKPSLITLALVSMSAVASQVHADTGPYKKAYQEPTRGFFIEHGTVAQSGKASIELHTGSDQVNSGGGIRLGLSDAELIVNSGLNTYDENELLLKWSLPRENKDGTKQTPLHWAVLGGISHTDIDFDNNTEFKSTSLKLGVAMTVKADAGTFTAVPKLVYAKINNENDTFVELDLGAYVGLIDTASGMFSAGIEATLTSADHKDSGFALGLRWSYNERLNLDFVPFSFSNDDFIGIPGLVRLNVNF